MKNSILIRLTALVLLTFALLVLGATQVNAQTTYAPTGAQASGPHYALFIFAVNNQPMHVVLDAGNCEIAIAYGLGDPFEVFYPSTCAATVDSQGVFHNLMGATSFKLDDGTQGTVNVSSWKEMKSCNNHGCAYRVVAGYSVSITVQ